MTTRAVATLLEIMSDASAPIRRRIEATEGLVGFEAPAEVVEQAKEFLTAVFENADVHVDYRLEALKLMRKAEARKVTQPTVPAAQAKRELEQWRSAMIGLRRVRLMKAGLWPASKDWADDILADTFQPPTDEPFESVWKRAIVIGQSTAKLKA